MKQINEQQLRQMIKVYEDTAEVYEDLTDVDTSEINDMKDMFCYCTTFNQDISGWNVGNVQYASQMFYACENFNQDITEWDVSNIKSMYFMFCNAESFNQDISCWNVANVDNMLHMFSGATAFIEGEYFIKTMISWAKQKNKTTKDLIITVLDQ